MSADIGELGTAGHGKQPLPLSLLRLSLEQQPWRAETLSLVLSLHPMGRAAAKGRLYTGFHMRGKSQLACRRPDYKLGWHQVKTPQQMQCGETEVKVW